MIECMDANFFSLQSSSSRWNDDETRRKKRRSRSDGEAEEEELQEVIRIWPTFVPICINGVFALWETLFHCRVWVDRVRAFLSRCECTYLLRPCIRCCRRACASVCVCYFGVYKNEVNFWTRTSYNRIHSSGYTRRKHRPIECVCSIYDENLRTRLLGSCACVCVHRMHTHTDPHFCQPVAVIS